MSEGTWQLATFGDGLEHVTTEAHDDTAGLLHLMPSITHLTIEVGENRIHIVRDWPSDQLLEADRLLAGIAGSGGITAIVVPATGNDPPRRVGQ